MRMVGLCELFLLGFFEEWTDKLIWNFQSNMMREKSEGIIYKIFHVVARNLSRISKKKKKTHVWTENFLHLFIFSVF